MPKVWLRALLCAGLLVSLATVATDAVQVIRVVGDNNYPPYMFVGADGKLRGYAVDEWRLWERKTGIKVELTATDWNDAQSRLLDGRADVIEMLFKTPRRQPLYDFSAPYTSVKVGVYADPAITGLDSPQSLHGFLVGVERGDACVDRLHAAGVDSLRAFTSYAEMIQAAARQEIRIFCMDEQPANYYLYRLGQNRFNKAFDFYSAQFHRGVRKGERRTLGLVEQGMAQITADERAALRRKWMGQPMASSAYAHVFIYALGAVTLVGIALLLWVRSLRRAVRRRNRELGYEQAQWRTLVDSNPDAIWLRDVHGTYLACNPQAARYLGKPAEQIVGQADVDIASPAAASERRQWDEVVRVSGRPLVREELAPAVTAGRQRTLEVIRSPVRSPQGELIGVLGVARDITGRKQAEERLQQAAQVFQGMLDGVMVTDIHGHIVAVNPAFCSITGYTESQVVGRTPGVLDGERVEGGPMRLLWSSIDKNSGWQGEMWNVRRGGERYPAWWTISAATDSDGKPTQYVGVFSDLGRIKRYENQLDFLAQHDPLTRLPNRSLLIDRLDHAIAQYPDMQLAILLIDLDNFKHVNESLGHPVGDLLLKAVAERLPASVPTADTVARLSGDEFVVTLSGQVGPTEISAAAEQILRDMARPFTIDGQNLFVGASIGISLYPDDGGDGVVLLRNADAAMYRAKQDGRNSCRFYSAALTRRAQDLLQLGSSLRRALDQDEFTLHYQPQVHVPSGRVVGVEALIRWLDPVHGMISPAQFIPYAEQSGLIEPIGRWVLHTACRQLAAWLAAGLPPMRMAVNLSPRQLASADLVTQVRAALADSGVPPDLLELEITEGALMEHGGQAPQILQALRELGVGLAIDDFGTGYSSLAYLRRFPVQLLKIDQSFMRDVPDDNSANEIATAIVAMAHSLHMHVLAEGVETGVQSDFLRGIGCDYAQGWHHGKPLPADQAEQQIRQALAGST